MVLGGCALPDRGTKKAVVMKRNTTNVVGNYELGKVLGSGDFDCRIRLCTHRSGATYAVKIYSKHLLSEAPWMWAQLAEAVQVMRTMPKNEHIIEMVECFETDTDLFILMQFVANSMSLYKIYSTPKESIVDMVRLTFEQKRKILEQVVIGLQHMHASGVAHLGVAPDHILLTQKNRVKISFLVACKNVAPGELLEGMAGTTHTVAPEILRQVPYDPFAADVWSLGVVLYFMLSGGTYPFDGANTSRHILAHSVRPLNPQIPVDARDLVGRMMAPDPAKRVSLKEVLAHPWLGAEHTTMRALVSADMEGKQLRIKMPPGDLTRREAAAFLIQGVWRFMRAANVRPREPSPALAGGAAAPSHYLRAGGVTSPTHSHNGGLLDGSEVEDAGPVATYMAGLPAELPSWVGATNQCDVCGRLPPPRIHSHKKPYETVATTFDSKKRSFASAVTDGYTADKAS
jgi:hypothetical protein